MIKNKNKNKTNEQLVIEKMSKKINNSKYVIKSRIKKRIRNSQSFSNVEYVDDKGILHLKTKEVAKVFSVQAIDLSLTSEEQKVVFYEQLKYLYQIKDLDLRIYKLDENINLNANKDHYMKLLDKYRHNEKAVEFLTDRYNMLVNFENDKYVVSNSYFFVVVANNVDLLNKQINEIEQSCFSTSPRVMIDKLDNKIEIYQFLVNLYFSDCDLEQLLWCNLTDLISPLSMSEKTNYIKLNNVDIELVSIKNIPLFVEELFFENIFNIPNTKCCIHIKDTINTEDLVRVLDSSYQFLLSDRSTTKKLSNATEMDAEKENFQALMNSIKNGDEKIKEVNFIIVINGTKQEREEKLKEIKKLADIHKLKMDVTKLRQMESWQSFDITRNSISDYNVYLPTLTLSAGFPLTSTSFNDDTGYFMGLDIHTALPVFFDLFHLNNTRTSHNMAVIASTGGGKSYTLKKVIVNEINRGTKTFIFDAEAEYKKLVLRNKGEYIDLYSKTGGIINPLQVRFLPSDDETRLNNLTTTSSDCPLPKHLGFLEAFFKCAFEHIEEKELIMLNRLLQELYSDFGIKESTSISELEKIKNTEFPTFTDLKDYIFKAKTNTKYSKQDIRIIEQLEVLISRFLVGTDSYLFNGYTNVNLDNDLIAFNLQELLYSGNQRIINTQVLNLLTFLNNTIVKNKILNDKIKDNVDKKHIAVIVDEFHLFIDEHNFEVLRNFGQLARRIRKYSGSFIPATQSIRDFVGNSQILRHATAIFNNCQYQLVGMMKEDDLMAFMDLFTQNPLTETQKQFLLRATQGEFLLNINNKKRLRLWIRTTELEEQLMGETK